MDVLTKEAERWERAAEVAGLELPEELANRLAILHDVDKRRRSMPTEAKVPTLAGLIAHGADPGEAQVEHALLLADAAKARELREATWQAYGGAARNASVTCAQLRAELILAARPLVTELVEEARPLAELLQPFAPKYDAANIVRHASPAQIKAWRQAEELERRFGSLLAAWRSSMNESSTMGGHPSPERIEGFDVRHVSQRHAFWSWSARVRDPRLRGDFYAVNASGPSRIAPTVLSVAREDASCGFRLATMAELAHLYRTGTRLRDERGGHQDGLGGVIFDDTPEELA